MSAEDLVNDGRLLVAETFIDTGRIRRPTNGAGTVDPVTQIRTPPAPVLVYEGPCRVRIPTIVQQNDVFGDIDVTTIRYTSRWAWDIPAVHKGDLVDIDTSPDPRITAVRFRVVAVAVQSALMYRLLGMEVYVP
jgi:hypothetical protein